MSSSSNSSFSSSSSAASRTWTALEQLHGIRHLPRGTGEKDPVDDLLESLRLAPIRWNRRNLEWAHRVLLETKANSKDALLCPPGQEWTSEKKGGSLYDAKELDDLLDGLVCLECAIVKNPRQLPLLEEPEPVKQAASELKLLTDKFMPEVSCYFGWQRPTPRYDALMAYFDKEKTEAEAKKRKLEAKEEKKEEPIRKRAKISDTEAKRCAYLVKLGEKKDGTCCSPECNTRTTDYESSKDGGVVACCGGDDCVKLAQEILAARILSAY